MPFTKIKYSKGEVILQWRDEAAHSTITHELSSSDTPRPELVTALAAFGSYILDICEFEATYARELTVQSVSISPSDKTGRGIVVTALKSLAGAYAPLVLNTPFLSEEASSEGGLQLPTEAVGFLDRLEAEAHRYRAGERAQQDFFLKKVS